MKKIVMIVMVAICSNGAFAQIQNINCTDDSSVVINNIYLGVLNSVNFSTKELTFSSPYNLQAAAMITWHASKWADVKTFAVYNRTNGNDAINNQFYVNLHHKGWSLDFGKMATPATEIRPLPPTANGHFETWTESQMPGSTIGAKIGYKTDFGSIKIGVASRNKNLEISTHLATKINNHEIHAVGAIGGERSTNYLVGLTHKYNRLYQVAAFKQTFNKESLSNEQIAGYFVNYEISKKAKFAFYLDAGYNLTTQKSPRFESGIMKSFESKIFKGLIALGYAEELKAIKGYIFIHL